MITARRTLRLPTHLDEVSSFEKAARDESATTAFGRTAAFCYVRLAEAYAGAAGAVTELPAGCEVLELETESSVAATALAERLRAEGTLQSIEAAHVADRYVVVEINGDLTTFVQFLDAVGKNVRRRAVLPLSDQTLVAVATWMWNAPQLECNRILEVAAGEAAPCSP